jgi:dTDP-4-amino-4,6-dideoxygalactose transaminase
MGFAISSAPKIPVPVPLVDLKAQFITIEAEVRLAIDRVLESQHFILGPEVEALEREIAKYCQCEYAIGVSSGTDAILISLMVIGVEPGDEIITTPYTFFATAGAIARLGGRPVFVDIDPRTFNLDPRRIEEVISKRTRAIIPVHLFGKMADMDSIMPIARKHKLFVIEDAAQAIGSERNGHRAGSIGDLACFSFFPSKNLGGFGDGGMVTTNDSKWADRLRLLRNHGFSPKYFSKVIGGNFRLDALQAAVLRAKFHHLDAWSETRRQNASYYREVLSQAGCVRSGEDTTNGTDIALQLPSESPHERHVFNQFVVRSSQRDKLVEFLQEQHIGTEIYYPQPMHLQECFAYLGHHRGDFPDSEAAAQESLALPIYAELTIEQQQAVVAAIVEAVEQCRQSTKTNEDRHHSWRPTSVH